MRMITIMTVWMTIILSHVCVYVWVVSRCPVLWPCWIWGQLVGGGLALLFTGSWEHIQVLLLLFFEVLFLNRWEKLLLLPNRVIEFTKGRRFELDSWKIKLSHEWRILLTLQLNFKEGIDFGLPELDAFDKFRLLALLCGLLLTKWFRIEA